ncbi:MAG TPA: hypothetical protein VIV55_04410 [Flavobacterium sp.]
MRNIFFLINILFTFSGFCQTNYSIKDFKKSPLPKVLSTEWYALCNSENDFSIVAKNDTIQITQSIYSSNFEYNLPEGKLIAINLGEWGGGLYYKPNDTINKHFSVNGIEQELKNDGRGGIIIFRDNPLNKLLKSTLLLKGGNIRSIFSFNGSLYLMEGLAHMGSSYGALYKMEQKNDSFSISKLIDFDDAPMAVCPLDDSILVATLDRFYIINKKMEKTLIFKDLFWFGLYPNSIARIKNKYAYIGMRDGFAKIDLKKKNLEFYKYIKK